MSRLLFGTNLIASHGGFGERSPSRAFGKPGRGPRLWGCITFGASPQTFVVLDRGQILLLTLEGKRGQNLLLTLVVAV
jgi:hypothetical protein